MPAVLLVAAAKYSTPQCQALPLSRLSEVFKALAQFPVVSILLSFFFFDAKIVTMSFGCYIENKDTSFTPESFDR